MPYKAIQGIYKIENLVNKKLYVGSAQSIKHRFVTHKNLLKKNKHFNLHLQSAWNKYGEANFEFSIVEITNCLDTIYEKEEFYIKLFDTNNVKFGYNKRLDCKTNRGIKASLETREKLRISHLGHKRSKEAQDKISLARFKSVCKLDLNGNMLETFDSLKAAAKGNKSISNCISLCCNKKTKQAYGYFWCFESELKSFTIPKKVRKINITM